MHLQYIIVIYNDNDDNDNYLNRLLQTVMQENLFQIAAA